MVEMEYFTLSTTKLLLGVTDRTLRRWRKSGKIKAIHKQGRAYYHAKDVIELRKRRKENDKKRQYYSRN